MLPRNEIDKPISSSAPMTIQRVAIIERAEMLVETPSRKALQAFPAAW